MSGPGETTFTAGDGEGIAAVLSDVTYRNGVELTVLDSAGDQIGSAIVVAPGGFVDTIALPGAGSYVARVTPNIPSQRGTFHLQLIHVPPDVTGEITPDAPPVAIANAVPGQNMRLTFHGTSGQRVSLSETNAGMKDGVTVSIRDPSDTTLSGRIVLPGPAFSDTTELRADGTYTVFIDPGEQDVGSLTIVMHEVPPDVVAQTEPNAKPFTVTTTVPGQNASFTFAGQAQQRVSMSLTDITVPTSVGVELDDSDGTRIDGLIVVPPEGFLDTVSLPRSGTYTMKLDPADDGTGSFTVALYDVPPDPVIPIAVNGPPKTVTTASPGQNIVLQIKGAPGTVFLHASDVSFPQGLTMQMLDATGKPVGTLSSIGKSGGEVQLTIDPTGLLVVRLDASEADVGHVTVSIKTP
ncbi:MAG TPA: hypothetical protein VID47_00495 [Actinomycetota bacterium]